MQLRKHGSPTACSHAVTHRPRLVVSEDYSHGPRVRHLTAL